jgi:glycosyltransferase involved in cell wall biosynthesis
MRTGDAVPCAPTLADYAGCRERRPALKLPSARPQITVLTICRNALATIERTLHSVQAQDGVTFEHVIVDGGSTDGTLALLERNLRPGDFLLSEPDRGISDALNKGIALATGEAIQLAHADDWLEPGQLALAHAALMASGCDYVFGDLLFHENGVPSFRYAGDPDYAASIDRRMPNLNHPTVLARRSSFERIGLFDLRYRCAMDYDWFLRLHRAGGRGLYVPGLRANMSHDGVSNLRFARTMREVAGIAVEHGRNQIRARLEMYGRIAKTGAGRLIKRRAAPAYRALRRVLNRSYELLAGP